MVKDNLIVLNKVESPEIMRAICTELRKKNPVCVFIAYGVLEGKAMLYLLIGDELIKQGFNASNIVKEVAPLISGNGGGQPFYAMITGTNPGGLEEAVKQIQTLLQSSRNHE
jgi:alanyl-tRNA synthetase